MKLIAIASDGLTEGDSEFNIHDFQVEYKEGMTLDDVQSAFPGQMFPWTSEITIAYVVDKNTFFDEMNKSTKELEANIEDREFARDQDDYDLNEAEREYLVDNALFVIQ